jgi:hypothetical protein
VCATDARVHRRSTRALGRGHRRIAPRGLAAPRTGSNAKKSLSRLGPETYRKVIRKTPNATL